MDIMDKDLLLSSYDFKLPKERIADRPVQGRHHSKLLVYNVSTDEVIHTTFLELPNFLPEDSTLVMNSTKVFPCRLVGKRPTGGKAEIFLLSLTPEEGLYPALIKTSRKKRIGDKIFFDGNLEAEIIKLGEEGTFRVRFNTQSIEAILYEVGKIPIPPYIRDGESDSQDLLDYQTVYAKNVGSVAAPTAGLHFTEELFENLKDKGIGRAEVTLHVGLGTFAPVKVDNILDHNMHTERYFVTDENIRSIKGARKRFAVGTTSLRVLESSIGEDKNFDLEAGKIYETNIFIYPGKEIHSIDGLITNFHLPKSTLLMLVSGLIGREKTLELYNIAVENEYRFFSYGDAMLIIR